MAISRCPATWSRRFVLTYRTGTSNLFTTIHTRVAVEISLLVRVAFVARHRVTSNAMIPVPTRRPTAIATVTMKFRAL
jgi:hypothetical protein